MDISIRIILIVALVTLCLLHLVNVVNCDATVASQPQDEPQAMGCNQQLQRRIYLQASLTLDAIDHFKRNFSWHKFEMDWDNAATVLDINRDTDFVEVCSNSGTCSRILPQVPLPPYSIPANASHAEQLMAEILEYARQYACALEILCLDQSLHEDSFQYHVNQIYSHLEVLISSIILGLRQCQVPMRETALRELMGKVYTGADRTLRDERAFRTIRQCQMGLHYIRHFFSLNDSHPLLR
ncbi:uncharacterized protein [Palaemon carinicauda]|uniref:uncharacterized protein n=1 Tax=Palaemon carinicauda TaxID=392227 RepID=UPI0035B62B96